MLGGSRRGSWRFGVRIRSNLVLLHLLLAVVVLVCIINELFVLVSNLAQRGMLPATKAETYCRIMQYRCLVVNVISRCIGVRETNILMVPTPMMHTYNKHTFRFSMGHFTIT